MSSTPPQEMPHLHCDTLIPKMQMHLRSIEKNLYLLIVRVINP